MAGYIQVNPRHRRARRRRARARRGTTHKRRRRVHVMRAATNPRRRRRARHNRRHHARRRVHRNPRIGGGVLGQILQGAAIGIGAGVVGYGVSQVAKKLPPALQAGPMTTVVKAGVGFGAAFLAGMLPATKGFKKPILLGTGALIAYDLWQEFVAPHLPSLMGYEVLHGYAQNGVELAPPQLGGVYQSSVYGRSS
jgi:hypothetical protein